MDEEHTGQVFSEGFLEDQELLRLYRAGDPAAYGALFARYRGVAYSYAHKYTNTQDQADDLVHEAFTRILEAIGRGKGPTVSMGHYLVSTIRNIATTNGTKERHELASDPQEIAEMYEREQFAQPGSTATWLTDAFNALSDRSQQVLWYRAVEDMPSREIASMLGMSAANATRVFQAAARELRQKFVAVSSTAAPDLVCRKYVPLLREIAEQTGKRRQVVLDSEASLHLASCPHCSLVASRVQASNRVLLSVVFLAGMGALGAYSLKTAPVATAASLFSALSLPLKAALIAAPVVGLAVTGAFLLGPQASNGTPATEVTLGQGSVGETESLIRVGSCELVRQTVDERTEVLSVSRDKGSCTAHIEFAAEQAAGDKKPQSDSRFPQVLEANGSNGVRTLEVVRPGIYTVTLSDGSAEQTVSVVVRDPA